MLLILFFGVGCDDRILVSGGFQVDVQFCKLPPFSFLFFVVLFFFHSLLSLIPMLLLGCTIHLHPQKISHLYFQNLGGLMNGTSHLFLLYHYSKYTHLSLNSYTWFLRFFFFFRLHLHRHSLLCHFYNFYTRYVSTSLHSLPTSKSSCLF